MKVPSLVLKKKLSASRDKVFEALSHPEIMKLWFKPDVKWKATSNNTFKVGGHYEHIMTSEDGTAYKHVGEYKEIIPSEKIVFTWSSPVVKDTLVTIELEDVDGFTELTLTHDLFPTEEIKEKHHQGWEGCLNSLTHYLS